MKIVINKCYGGFSLSPEALQRLYDMGMLELATPAAEYFGSRTSTSYALQEWRAYRAGSRDSTLSLAVFTPDENFVLSRDGGVKRDDPRLVRVVREMGEGADGSYAKLTVVEIPDGVEYEVQEYDGMEHIAEKHRTWE